MIKNNFIFKNGLVFYKEIQLFIFPINSFLCIFNKLLENYELKEIILILDESSKQDSSILFKNIEHKKITKLNKIKLFIEFLNNLGFGFLHLKFLKHNKILFYMDNLILSKTYEDLFKNNSKLLPEYFLISILKNFLILFFNSNIVDEKIIYKNKKIIHIYFEFDFKKVKNTNFANFSYKYLKDNELESNSFLKKIKLNNSFKNNLGNLKIWNINLIAFPFYNLIFFLNHLERKKEIFDSFFNDLGLNQGRLAAKMQSLKFGIKKEEKIFFQTIEQSSFLGGGIIELKIRKNRVKFKFNNNINSEFKLNLSDFNFDLIENYFNNLVRGAFEFSFNKKTKIEFKNGNFFIFKVKNDDLFLENSLLINYLNKNRKKNI